MYLANPSPHVKSGIFMGQMKSAWRAMTSPVFDFQGDLHQQGGAIIAGPGKLSLCLCTLTYTLALLPVHCVTRVLFCCFFSPQAHRFIFLILIQTAWTTCPLTGSCNLLEFNRHWTSAISQRSSTYSKLTIMLCMQWCIEDNTNNYSKSLIHKHMKTAKKTQPIQQLFKKGISSLISL